MRIFYRMRAPWAFYEVVEIEIGSEDGHNRGWGMESEA